MYFKIKVLTPKLCRFTRKMSNVKCTVAVCQFTASNNKENNLIVVKDLVKTAAQKQAKIVFLPEACDYIATNKEEAKALAEPLTGTLINEYKILAKTEDVWLSIGGFHESLPNESKIYNSHILIDNKGEIKANYRKIHLFDVSIPESNVYLRESDATLGGQEIVPPVATPAGALSLSVCYDLRFPELSLLQRKEGAEILTYPSAFTQATGVLHWEILLRARAIETQCFVIAAAQYGKHNAKRTSFGQSLIIDPQGKILAQCPQYKDGHETNQSIAVAEIDLALIQKVRKQMPVFEHRRSDLYFLEGASRILSIEADEAFMFANKPIPGSTVFYKTKYSFAFTNIRCVVPGHVLICPQRCAKRLEDLSPIEINDFFQTAVKVQKVMETVFGADSSTICVQDGKNAGQTHVHVHILPRKENDFECNDEIYDRLAKHDRDNDTPIRNNEEMTEEAQKLRPYFY